MKLELKLRNNTWYIYGYVSGERVRESTGIARANKSAADLYLAKKISMLQLQIHLKLQPIIILHAKKV